MTLSEAIAAANAADDEFEKSIRAAGYKSRWDWSSFSGGPPQAAYLAKVKADLAMHKAFEAVRNDPRKQMAVEWVDWPAAEVVP